MASAIVYEDVAKYININCNTEILLSLFQMVITALDNFELVMENHWVSYRPIKKVFLQAYKYFKKYFMGVESVLVVDFDAIS